MAQLSFRMAAGATFGLILLLASAISSAAPVVFEFEATISGVEGYSVALHLPFSLDVGQQIEGRYVFNSDEDLLDIFSNFFPHEHGKFGALSLEINGSVIGAAINVGSINSNPIDINAPPLGPASSISLGYANYFTDVFPGWGGQTAGHPWNPGLELIGSEGTISGLDDVLDVGAWNQLTTQRLLSLRFGYFESSQFHIVTYLATVGSFSAIPEPPTMLLLALCALPISAWRRPHPTNGGLSTQSLPHGTRR